MAEVAGAIAYGLKEVAEGAVLLAKGIYDPTLPLKAKLQPITSIDVPLAYHTVSVVNGRAYLFGGKSLGKDNELQLNENLHIVILPASGIESADYKKIERTSDAPPTRHGHSASVIDESIYIFGGLGENDEAVDEDGRVWVYNTRAAKWTYLDPPEATPRPSARSSHASVASEHPRPATPRPSEDVLPQQPPDPENNLPKIPEANTHGTLIVQGGRAKSGNNLLDLWSFDISSRTWAELPDSPGPSTSSPSLALMDQRLYTFSAGQTSYLDINKGSYDDFSGRGELGLTPIAPWQSLPPTSSAPDKDHPGERSAASMIPITTGQGRNYLLLIGGRSQSGEFLEDIWVHQLKPEGMTAASFKDAARTVIKKGTNEAEWDQVKYLNSEGVMIQEGQFGRGIGPREGFAAAGDTNVDGASVLIWGGIGADDKPRGDGLMITVDV